MIVKVILAIFMGASAQLRPSNIYFGKPPIFWVCYPWGIFGWLDHWRDEKNAKLHFICSCATVLGSYIRLSRGFNSRPLTFPLPKKETIPNSAMSSAKEFPPGRWQEDPNRAPGEHQRSQDAVWVFFKCLSAFLCISRFSFCTTCCRVL